MSAAQLFQKLSIDESTAFWSGLSVRDSVAIREIASGPYDPGLAIDIPALGSFNTGSEPWIWHSPNRDQAILNSECFGPWRVVSAINPAEAVVVGSVAEHVRFDLLVRFILVSGLVRTFAHLDSELIASSWTDHEVKVDGVHRYATNDVYEESFSFRIRLDPASREVCVAPEAYGLANAQL